MAPRANWKGYLKLSLVTCAIALFLATTSNERVAFHYINRRTRNRLKQQYVDSETDDVVDSDDRVRGFEVAKNEFIPIEDEELENVRLESTHTIEIETFVNRADVDEIYFDSHYFLAPEDKVGVEAFIVIREAMASKKVAGLAKVVLYGRERILLLEPRDRGLLGSTLRYDYEVRDEKAYFEDIPDTKIPSEMMSLALHIIDGKKGAFKPSEFKDRYQDAVVDLVREKRAGHPLERSRSEAKPSNVVSLMDALKKSLVESGKPRAPAAKAAKRASATRGSRTASSGRGGAAGRTKRRKAS